MSPMLDMILWQGTIIDIGFLLFAFPTALYALGFFIDLAISL